MNNSTYELLTQQLRDKDKRIDFLERLIEKNGQDSNPDRDDIDYRKAGRDFLEVMNAYLEAQQDDMLFDPSQELHKLYEDLHNIYWNIV